MDFTLEEYNTLIDALDVLRPDSPDGEARRQKLLSDLLTTRADLLLDEDEDDG